MILVEREQALPVAVETVKAQVLICLQAMHAPPFDFSTQGELAAFLDQVQTELKAAGFNGELSRILLFHRSDWAVAEVAKRMQPGASFQVFRAPSCWTPLGQRLPELKQWARRIEPSWAAEQGI